MLDPQLTNQRILITGGATGIGLGIALALAREGARLVIASRNPDPEGIAQLKETGAEIHALPADVSTEAGACAMVREAISNLGGLDAYVNNAAVSTHEPVTRISSEGLAKVFDTNARGAVFACREVARQMTTQRSGCILIIGSTSRLTPSYGDLAYRLAKTSLKVLMESLALELAPHAIRVNLLTPGHYPTGLTSGLTEAQEAHLRSQIPLRRFGDPLRELSAAALLLLSDALSSYTTGTELIVDGGLTLRPINFWTDAELRSLNQTP